LGRKEPRASIQRMEEIDVDYSNEESKDLAPTHVGADVLIGTMPIEVHLDEMLHRLTSKNEWKPMRVALTEDAVCIARIGEKILRERIPLLEIETIRQCSGAQRSDESVPTTAHPNTFVRLTRGVSSLSGANIFSMSLLLDANMNDRQHIIEVITKKNGYNCGKSYYLKAASEEKCASWIAALKSTTKVARARAVPHPLAKYQRWLRTVYRHPWFQTVVAVQNNRTHLYRTHY
jgi:hypothetical protein